MEKKPSTYFRLPGPVTSVFSMRSRSSFTGRLMLGFIACYLLAIFIISRFYSYRDPTSLFFNPNRGYELGYTAVRQKQADDFIADADLHAPSSKVGSSPALCVGVASIARGDVRYFKTTVGSLLEGLHPDERSKMHLILFAAHTTPTDHPAYKEKWFHNVADRVLKYDVSTARMAHLKKLEQDGANGDLFVEKGLYDHAYLMKACLNTNAPYMALIEDDVIAMDGWFHRTIMGIRETEKKTAAMGRARDDFFYLRLFYTEQYLGWNSEEWMTYLGWSLAAFFVLNFTLLVSRRCVPSTRNVLSTRNIVVICFLFLPLSILLLFAAGRVTTVPRAKGVDVMNQFGCCFQGIVFPRGKARKLIDYYDKNAVGFKDTASEDYADRNGEVRFALTPGVLQHVGVHSSKGDDFADSTRENFAQSQTLWSFPFELYDAKKLRKEHDAIIGGGPH